MRSKRAFGLLRHASRPLIMIEQTLERQPRTTTAMPTTTVEPPARSRAIGDTGMSCSSAPH